MANVDAPHGFRPVRTLDGSPIMSTPYPIDASGATIGIGDLIVLEADGNVTKSAASPTDGTVIGVAASSHITGTAGTVDVWDNPSIVFEGQTDNGTGVGTSQIVVGANLNLVDGAASSAGISIQELDESSAATTATLPFKVLGLHKEVGNVFGEFNKLEFIINNHAFRGGTGTGIHS